MRGLALTLAFLHCMQAASPAGMVAGEVLNVSTGAPLKKAIVELTGVAERIAETDAKGHFSFTGLDPGRYELMAQRPGFLPQRYGGRRYAATPISLTPDEHRTDMVIKLTPMSVISGRVTDEDGEAVMDLEVYALRLEYEEGKRVWKEAGKGTTSDLGEYRIPSLKPGRYLVKTEKRWPHSLGEKAPGQPLPESPDIIYPETYHPGTTEQSAAPLVEVAAGGEGRGVDIHLTPVKAFRIRGTVVLPKGAAPATIAWRTAQQTHHRIYGETKPPDNRFAIAGLAPGSYVVMAQPDESTLTGQQQVEITDHHIDGVVLRLLPGGDVHGTVKMEDATPLPDLSRVRLKLKSPNAIYWSPDDPGVAADGTFVLKNVSPGRFEVTVEGVPGSCYVRSMRYDQQEIGESGAEWSEGTTLEIVLSAAAAQVAGVVVDKDGKPVVGAIVALIGQAGIRGSTTDEIGQFRFAGLKPAEYKLLAWEDIEPGSFFDADVRKPFESRAETVTLEAGSRHRVQLTAISAEETSGK